MTSGPYDWRSIVALNAVSTIAQVGQFGIPFMVLPLWLEQHGASNLELSLFASSLWVGQLPGMHWAPRMTDRFGAKRVILAALLSTVLALALLAVGIPELWLLAGLLAGLGQGLRWIGLEPWLYRIAPGHARGRLVGFHESLIALAPIVAPALCGWLGVRGSAPLVLGVGFALVSAVPLIWAKEEPHLVRNAALSTGPGWHMLREPVFVAGSVLALFGGMSESAFAGLFSVYGRSHQLDAGQVASLLMSFGLGGLFLQYAAGWLADHRGVGFACLCCSIAGAGVAVLLTFSLGTAAMHAAVFALGGIVTAYLTLALIASTKTSRGSMAHNMSMISMTYTASAIAGPPIAAGAIQWVGGNGLMWTLAAMALTMIAFLSWVAKTSRPEVATPAVDGGG
jgi:MFS family permease